MSEDREVPSRKTKKDMSETISSPIEEKGRLSFFYDKNWKPFQLFIRKRFALPRRVLRNIYDESFYQLAKEANTPSEDNAIPLKIKLFRKGIELILQSDKGEKERTDSKAFEEEFIGQSETENRSITETLDKGWELLGLLPREELDRIDTKILDEYYDAGEAMQED